MPSSYHFASSDANVIDGWAGKPRRYLYSYADSHLYAHIGTLKLCILALVPEARQYVFAVTWTTTFVTVADYTLLALVPAVHKELGAFIPLIVANCMILGRQEAFASRYPVRLAVMDAMGMAGGFMLALFSLGAIREILGDGALFGVSLFGPNFEPWVIMILPPGGFLTLGVILLFFNWFKEKKDEFLQQVAEAERSGN